MDALALNARQSLFIAKELEHKDSMSSFVMGDGFIPEETSIITAVGAWTAATATEWCKLCKGMTASSWNHCYYWTV